MKRLTTALASLVASPASAQTGPRLWLDEVLATATADHMSPLGMFLAADWVVQSVMVFLVLASAMSWGIVVAKLLQLSLGRRALRRDYRLVDGIGTLQGSVAVFEKRHRKRQGTTHSKRHSVVAEMLRATVHERDRSGADTAQPDGIKERAASLLGRIEAGAARRMANGTGVLANIGSTAPFIGLFGTVWGIMHSFVAIAQSNTTNLAVVAPGIAEALLATALGLVAAIPAVIFYNMIARGLGHYRLMLGDAAALLERTLSRDLDRAEHKVSPTFTLTQAAE